MYVHNGLFDNSKKKKTKLVGNIKMIILQFYIEI